MLQQATLQFYRELRENNHKEWFDVNRPRYLKAKENYLAITAGILSGLQKHDAGLLALQPKDCIFRINRDIRFSNDKRPYKTNLGIFMTPGGRSMQRAGYYVHLDEAEGSFAGGGIYMPPADVLKKVRREISDFFEDLEAIVHSGDFRETYGDFDREPGVVLSRPPKGYTDSDPAIEILKLKSYTASTPLPVEMLTDIAGVQKVIDKLVKLKPLIDFLNRALQNEM